jgi:hypothetical protein
MAEVIYQGEYFKVSYVIMDRSVEPAVPADISALNLTGWVGWKHEPQLIALEDGVGITITDGSVGELDVELTSTQTQLAPRVYQLELWGDDGTKFELLDRFDIEIKDSWRIA